MRVAALLSAAMAVGAKYTPQTQMNGAYSFANPTKASPTVHRGDDYFEVYSPVYTSLYGQVNWNGFTIELPKEITDAWENRTMNIVGYEFDAIRSVAGVDHPCVNNITAHSDCKTTSVPAWEQYNHHYGNSVSGTGIKMIADPVPKLPSEWDPVEHMMGFQGYKFVSTEPGKLGAKPKAGSSTGGLPMGNGAESRFTFHYFPPGYGAQVISPKTTEIRPMFIDTKNRWGTGEHPTRHGPVPKNSNVPPEEMYSGMMECPCSDRYLKTFSTASTMQAGSCGKEIFTDAKACYAGAASLGFSPSKSNNTVNDPTKPSGCTGTAVAGGFEIEFNSAATKVSCGTGNNATHPRAVGQIVDDAIVTFDTSVDLAKDLVTITASAPADAWFGVGYGAQTMDGVCVAACPPKPGTNSIIFMTDGTVHERELGMHMPGSAIPVSVKVVDHKVENGRRHFVVTRSLKGMTPKHYTFKGDANSIDFITALGSSPTFGYHKVKSSGTIFFAEVGAPTCMCMVGYDEGTLGGFAWGGQRCAPPPLASFIADPNWNNSKGYNNEGNGTSWPSWNNNPIDTDNDGINPTCSLKQYRGGLRCCHGNDMIADTELVTKVLAEQNKTGAVDYFQMKYRYYFEDATPGTGKLYHGRPPVDTKKNIGWFTEHGNNENDVPPCNPKANNPGINIGPEHAHQGLNTNTDCMVNITSNFTGAQFCPSGKGEECQLIHMLGHCHIGSLGMQLWNMSADGGPQVICQTWNDYGRSDATHDEMGYLLGSRPCIYGWTKDGFIPPPVVRATDQLMSLKMSNNTHARFGDMGLWEIKGALVPAGTSDTMAASGQPNFAAEIAA